MADEPSEELHDPTKFLVPEFPWMLARQRPGGALLEADVFRTTLTSGGEPIGDVLLMFTDEPLAEDFAANLGPLGLELAPFRFTLKVWMFNLLTELKKSGVTHAYFDPNHDGSLPANRPVVPIDTLIDLHR